jgi:hypothetical protein
MLMRIKMTPSVRSSAYCLIETPITPTQQLGNYPAEESIREDGEGVLSRSKVVATTFSNAAQTRLEYSDVKPS